MKPAAIVRKGRLAWGMLRYQGLRWVLFRLRYALRMRSGALARRAPLVAWSEVPLATVPPRPLAWPDTSHWPKEATSWGDCCIAQAAKISEGEFELFSHHRMRLGFPPNWRRNPFSGQIVPRGGHWSELGDFDFGDIKTIWEPSRFSWAYTLVRAHARTGDERHAKTFWRLLEDWCEANPPNEGVNWKCGQESTFRLMAVAFAVAQFARLQATTPARMETWSRFVTATGRRIAANLDYALSQSNNHGVSECVGLITAALASTETDETREWRDMGFRQLQAQLAEIVYPDGGFSQYSVIYHRVLLDDLYWLIVVLRAANEEVPGWVVDKTRSALEFLAELVDPQTGGAPLLGSNDGSQIRPLDEGDYADLRGTVQAGYALLVGTRALPAGPWNEDAFWLTGREPGTLPERAVSRRETWHAPEFGAFQWLSGDARLFLFCPTRFRHRVVQVDMLHADVWWRGRAVAHDAGSYSYNAADRFAGAFSAAAVHNVPTLAGVEPLRHASRFFYLPWPRGTAGWSPNGRQFCATHDAYGSAAAIERRIESPLPGVFVVTDVIRVSQPGKVRLHWLLADWKWTLDAYAACVFAPLDEGRYSLEWNSSVEASGASLVRADPVTSRGWWSPYYLDVEPAVSLELLFDVDEWLEVSMRFGLAAIEVRT